MKDLVGLEFRPTDDELVGFYLHNKIQGNTWLVEGAINEVNICDFDPWNLCFQSKIKSKDRVWYFFSRRKNKYGTGDRQNRKTPSGKWKLTGVPTVVMDHLGRCGIRGKIGHKRCLEFVNSVTGLDDKWVIHEYHNTVVLPEHLRTTYVICRLEYKGDDISILSANAIDPTPSFVANMTNSEGSVVNQSQYDNIYSEDDSTNHGQHLNGYFNMPDQVPYSVSYDGGRLRIWDYEVDFNTDQSLHELLPDERTSMQENRNVCIPKKPVTGYLTYDSSNSDTDSMFGSDNSSGTDSVGEAPSTKTVKQKWIVLEKISQRNSQWIYLKNMIIGFLLFISVIRWIILV